MSLPRNGPRNADPRARSGPVTVPGRGYQPKHAPRIPFALLVVGLVVGGLCALLALNTASAANELARHDLATKDSDVSARLEQARNQVAASAAPGALGNAAAALGMVPAGAPAFLRIDANGKVTVLGSPAPASTPPTPPPTLVPRAPKTTPKVLKTPKKPASTGRNKTKTPKHTPKPTPKPKPTPTPVPTPITTLPGGTR